MLTTILRATIISAVAATATAQNLCPIIEFAEMDSMAAEELLNQHCDYQQIMFKAVHAGAMRAANQCAIELNRSERIVARKYNIPSTGDQRVRDVAALCKRRP